MRLGHPVQNDTTSLTLDAPANAMTDRTGTLDIFAKAAEKRPAPSALPKFSSLPLLSSLCASSRMVLRTNEGTGLVNGQGRPTLYDVDKES